MRITKKRNFVKKHEFERAKINGFPKYQCKNCGCVEDVSFVKGYMRGLQHGSGTEEKP